MEQSAQDAKKAELMKELLQGIEAELNQLFDYFNETFTIDMEIVSYTQFQNQFSEYLGIKQIIRKIGLSYALQGILYS